MSWKSAARRTRRSVPVFATTAIVCVSTSLCLWIGSCSMRSAGSSGTSSCSRPASSAAHNDDSTSSASTIAVSSSAAVAVVVDVIAGSLPAPGPRTEPFSPERQKGNESPTNHYPHESLQCGQDIEDVLGVTGPADEVDPVARHRHEGEVAADLSC